jgi:hypothetical protein
MLPWSNIDCKNNVVALHNTKAYEGVELQLHSFINSALDGMSGQLHATAALLSGKNLAGLLRLKLCGCLSWCGRFGEEINLSHSCRKSNYDYLHVQPVA